MELKSFKPMFTKILVTCKETGMTDNGIILVSNKGIEDVQEVREVGTSVRDIKKGDKVLLNFERYGVKKHEKGSLKDGVVCDNPIYTYDLPYVEVAGERLLCLDVQDVVAIVEV